MDETEFDVINAPAEVVWIEEDSESQVEAPVALTSTITLNAADVYGQPEREIRASEASEVDTTTTAATEVGASKVVLSGTIALNVADVYGQREQQQ